MSLDSNGDASSCPGCRRILLLMFCLGAYALLAQVLLLREFLVVFLGNELAIGALFSVWLMLVGAGSLLAAHMVMRWPEGRLRVLLVSLLTLASILLPLQVGAIRIVRTTLNVAYGEYVPFFAMLESLAVMLAPTCLIIGIVFPCACRLITWHWSVQPLSFVASRVYAVESLGSLVAGVCFSFWLVWVMSPLAVAALAGVIVLLGAIGLTITRPSRWLLGLAALAFMVLACCPACLAPIERASVAMRWRSIGALPAPDFLSTSAARLLAACDSRYQNLALIETEGQMTLYANGQVAAVFPDAVISEHKVHFVMAQKPDARQVLLIGGDPINDIPELLKYPLARLVYVELDDQIGHLLEPVVTEAYAQALCDPRLVQAHVDGPLYVKQYGRGGGLPAFDVILVDAAEPVTMTLNRFYTQEFYRDIRSILSPGGFLYTSVSASEDLQGESAYLSASIYATLRKVFDRVLVTAGPENQFFAGTTESPIAFTSTELFRRSVGADITTLYFRPEYFFDADEISPEKLDFVRGRLAAIPVAINTALRPVATFYHVMIWSRLSGSRLESLLARLAHMRPWWIAGALMAWGVVCLGVGVVLGRRRLGAATLVSGFSRSMLMLVMVTTGLCGIALELILLFIFQARLGYVYSKVGLIVAMFMFGLSLGAFGVPRLIRGGARMQWRAMFGVEIFLIALAIAIPWLIAALSGCLESWLTWWLEALIYGLIVVSGALVGAQFALVNERLCHGAPAAPAGAAAGANQGLASALTNTADLVGAALGGLFVGVLLLPLFGIVAGCLLLAVLKITSLLCLWSAWRTVASPIK